MNTAELAAGFMSLFSGLDRAHGSYVLGKKAATGEKQKGRALTEQKPVTVDLWVGHLEGKRGLGIVPIRMDGTVLWAALDIDVYDLDIKALEQKLLSLQLPLVVARTKSGGAHLYLFCGEPMQARYIRAKLAEWAALIGYPKCEIFPKQDEITRPGDTGNWINMPYFDHEQTLRYVIWNGEPLTAEQFLEKAETRKVTKLALDAFATTPGTDQIIADGPPCLQHLTKNGFPRGTRNRGLFNLGVLARFSCGEDWSAKLDEFNRAYMLPPLSTSEVANTQKSLGRKNYFYTCTQDPIASVCSKDVCRTRKFGIGNSDLDTAPVSIDNLTIINSVPPVYVVEVEGVRFECSSADLMNQARFRLIVLEHARRVIPLIKNNIWERMLAERFKDAEVIEAPTDAGPEGQFLAHLENFCTSRVTANTLDEILLGKPFIDQEKDRTFFRSPDLIRYLEQQHFKQFTERQIWAILKRHSCSHHQFMLKGKCVTAWAIPTFKKQSEGFTPPKVDGDDL